MEVPNLLYKVRIKTLKCCKVFLTLMITDVTKSNSSCSSQVSLEVSEERCPIKPKDNFEPDEGCIGQKKANDPSFPKENLPDSHSRTPRARCLTFGHDIILWFTDVLDHIHS